VRHLRDLAVRIRTNLKDRKYRLSESNYKATYSSDVSQPSLGVEHELTTNTGEIDTETPPMRAPISVHQRSPGGMHGQMETHWEENNSPACRYFNKHFARSISL